MRVLLANEARAGGGGVETYLTSIASALASRGHRVALLYANPSAEDGPTRIVTEASWSVADLGLDAALAQATAWHPDAIFSHNMNRLDVDEALVARAPVVKMMHGYFGTCVSGQKAFLFPATTGCTRVCGPACLVLYAPRRCGKLGPNVIADYRWAARQRALFDRYHSIVVASRHMRAEYLAHGVSRSRVHAIPLFGGPHPPPTRSSSLPPSDVVFVGRLTPLKGPDLLVAAADIASRTLGRRLSVTLAGEGPLRARLARLTGRTSVDLRLTGWLDPQARTDLFASATLLAVPSAWPEPFGMVGLEAAALGVPAVAFDVGGVSDWLVDGVNGILVRPAGDANMMAAAIVRVLQDPVEQARLSSGARAAAAHLSVGAHLAGLEPLLEAAGHAVAS